MSGNEGEMDYLNDKKSPLLWGSHLPVLQAVIDAFPIVGALELGSGLHSTAILFDRLQSVVSIENYESWIDTLRENIQEDEKHYFAHFPFSHSKKAQREEIGQEALQKATEFYRSHMTFNPNLLFVDCFRGYRLQAMIDLHKDFDVIVYHDAQPRVDFRYGYSTFVPERNFIQYIDRTFPTHTGVYINVDYKDRLASFIEHHNYYALEWAKKFSVVCPVFLERIR